MEAERFKVFISYSRVDRTAADALVDALSAQGFEVMIDRRRLAFGEKWQAQLAEFIRLADTVVWLVSEPSIQSRWVNWELDEVAKRHKRLIPVMVGDTPRDQLPRQIGDIHLLPAEGLFDPTRDLSMLVRVLENDTEWLREASRLGDRALEWQAAGHPSALLLRGPALTSAESWKDRKPAKAPSPAQDVLDLILVSRQAAARRLRWGVGGSLAVAVTALALTGYAFVQRSHAEREGERALASARTATARLLATQAVAEIDSFPQRAALLMDRSVATAHEASGQIPADVRQAQYRIAERLGGATLPLNSHLLAGRWILVPSKNETKILDITDLCDTTQTAQVPGEFKSFIHDESTGTALLVGTARSVLLQLPRGEQEQFQVKSESDMALPEGKPFASTLSDKARGLMLITSSFAVRYLGIGASGELIDAATPVVPDHEFFLNRQNFPQIVRSPADALLGRVLFDRASGTLLYHSANNAIYTSKVAKSSFSPWRKVLENVSRIWLSPTGGYLVVQSSQSSINELSIRFVDQLDGGSAKAIAKLEGSVTIVFDSTGDWLVAGSARRVLLARVSRKEHSVRMHDLGGTWGHYGLTGKFSDDSRLLLTRASKERALLWDLASLTNGEPPRRASFGMEGAHDFEFSSDLRWLVGTYGDAAEHKVLLYRIEETTRTPKLIKLPAEFNAGRFEKFSPDSKWLLLEAGVRQDRDDRIRGEVVALKLPDDGSGPSLSYKLPAGHRFPTFFSRFLDDEPVLVTEEGNSLFAWRLNDRMATLQSVMRGHEALIDTGQVARDRSCFITTSHDRTRRIWPTRFTSTAARATFPYARGAVVLKGESAVAVLQESRQLVAFPAGASRRKLLWSLDTPLAVDGMMRAPDTQSVSLTSNGSMRKFALASFEPTMLRELLANWVSQRGDMVVKRGLDEGQHGQRVTSSDGKWIANYDSVNVTLSRIGSEGPRPVSSAAFRQGMSVIHRVAFLPDSSLLIAQSVNEPPFIWRLGPDDMFDGPAKLDDGRPSQYKLIKVSPDGRWLLLGHNHNRGASLYDLAAKPLGASPIALAPHDEGDVEAVVFSPDSNWLAISTSAGLVSLRRTGANVASVFAILDNSTRADRRGVAFSPGGQWVVVSSSRDLILRRRMGEGWEESGARIVIDHDCGHIAWLGGDEELVCVGKDKVSIVAVSSELLEQRLQGLIQRKLTNDEMKLFNLESRVGR